jgi:hypothetical protein
MAMAMGTAGTLEAAQVGLFRGGDNVWGNVGRGAGETAMQKTKQGNYRGRLLLRWTTSSKAFHFKRKKKKKL